MNDIEFRAMLDFFMCADYPSFEDESYTVLEEWLDRESRKRGYEDWVNAYHEFVPPPDGGEE